MKKLLAVLLVVAVSLGVFTACNGSNNGAGDYTYRTYTSVMPSNWNELTYEDNNDTQIMNYLGSSFFEYDYQFEGGEKYTASGEINADAIVPGGFTVNYSAATKLEDVTKTVDASWGYTDKQKENGSYAWKITLRQDLKWDDGTPINAHDFVYTMKAQLDPKFQNMRASTFYNNIQIKNARNYVYQGQSGWFPADGPYTVFEEALYDRIVFSLASSEENKEERGGAVCSMRGSFGFPGAWTAAQVADYLVANGINKPIDATVEELLALEGKTYAQIVADEALNATWTKLIDSWQTEPNEELDFFVVEYTYPELSFEKVGMYAASDYEIVVCLDAPIACLKEDGSLSYEAAYSFASLPLVKQDLYESCVIEPAEGATLYTTNYNSSLATSASWGPYKLTQFQSGKAYTLSRNDNWYGYGMNLYKNQYKVNKIFCEQISEVNTQWTKFLAGEIDDIGLDVGHKDDYRNSKYTYYTPSTGTFGVNLYANLETLKTSGRNNGILAILEFRKAFSLYLDREEYNAKCFTSNKSCYGLLGPSYYYDVENGGVYRDTQIAKEGLLRVYGFTQNGDGTWTDGTNTYSDYQKAYDAMNGMNRTLSKQLIEEAYTELTENAEKYGYDATKQIEIKFGTSTDNVNTRRHYDYMKNTIEEMVKGTSLEGKINFTFDSSFGENWAKDFKSGAYDFAVGTGFSGGAFDPEGFLQCYLDPNAGLMYSTWWDTSSEMLTYTMPAGDYEGAGEELTMSLLNWYACLNGIAEAYGQSKTYNWGAGFIPETARMTLLSKLEEVVLGKYFSVMTTSQFSATVTSAKFSYITDDFNLFMDYGEIRYMKPNYDDAEWRAYVSANNNNLESEYKKSE